MGYDVPVSKESIGCYSRLQARKRRRHDIDTAEILLLLARCESGISVGIYRSCWKAVSWMWSFEEGQSPTKVLHRYQTLPLGIHEWCFPDVLKLSKFQILVMFFLKIRLNLYDEDIAYRFGIHVSTVSRNFHRVLDILSVYTTGFIKWPDRETLQLTMPSSFQKFFKKCAIIIDCSEVIYWTAFRFVSESSGLE